MVPTFLLPADAAASPPSFDVSIASAVASIATVVERGRRREKTAEEEEEEEEEEGDDDDEDGRRGRQCDG